METRYTQTPIFRDNNKLEIDFYNPKYKQSIHHRALVIISPLSNYHKGKNLNYLLSLIEKQKFDHVEFLLVDLPKKHSFKMSKKYSSLGEDELHKLAANIGDEWLNPTQLRNFSKDAAKIHTEAVNSIHKKFKVTRWSEISIDKNICDSRHCTIFSLKDDLSNIIATGNPEKLANMINKEAQYTLARLRRTKYSGLPIDCIDVPESEALNAEVAYIIEDITGILTHAVLGNFGYMIYPLKKEPKVMQHLRLRLRDIYGYKIETLPRWLGYNPNPKYNYIDCKLKTALKNNHANSLCQEKEFSEIMSLSAQAVKDGRLSIEALFKIAEAVAKEDNNEPLAKEVILAGPYRYLSTLLKN